MQTETPEAEEMRRKSLYASLKVQQEILGFNDEEKAMVRQACHSYVLFLETLAIIKRYRERRLKIAIRAPSTRLGFGF